MPPLCDICGCGVISWVSIYTYTALMQVAFFDKKVTVKAPNFDSDS
jgi:hypothetical protein